MQGTCSWPVLFQGGGAQPEHTRMSSGWIGGGGDKSLLVSVCVHGPFLPQRMAADSFNVQALAQGPAPLALPGGLLPGRTWSAQGFGTRSCPIGSARGCFQAEPCLQKALAQGPTPLALPGEVVSRQTLVCTRLQHKVLPHWLFQGRLLGRYLFVGADALRSTVCLCRRSCA